VGVVVSVLVGLLAGPALALPDNAVEFVRGQGSDTTYLMMTRLDAAFNNSIGCPNTADNKSNRTSDSATANPDSSCTPSVLPGQMGPENWDHDVALSFWPVGSGNGLTELQQFAKTDFCGGSTGSTGSDPYPGQPCGYLPIDYARSSSARPGSGFGSDANLRFVAYARDGIAPVNFSNGTTRENSGPANGVINLTQQQVKDIFVNCKENTDQPHPGSFPRWSDYGGSHSGQPEDAIIVWTDQASSGTRKTFDAFIGGSSDSCIPGAMKDGTTTNGERVIFENDPTPIHSCSTFDGGSCANGGPSGFTAGGQSTEPTLGANTDLSSIYFMSFGVYNTSPPDPNFGNQKAEGADLISVDGVAPSANSITSPPVGSGFPYSRFLYNVYRATFSSNNIAIAAKDYVGEKGWICKGSASGSGLSDAVAASGDTFDGRGGHTTDPATGVNYSVEISNTISNVGFVPLSFGPIGGGISGNSHCRVS
jgi:ABC-type phosphate transport system substrate-binding protein